MLEPCRHNDVQIRAPDWTKKGDERICLANLLDNYQRNRRTHDLGPTNRIRTEVMSIFLRYFNGCNLATVANVSLGKALQCVVDKNEPIGSEYRGGLTNRNREAITTQILERMCGMRAL
jgi:hypothetical protein